MSSPTGRGAAPDILLVMADQFAAHALSCVGATHVSTPNLDRLAKRGARFDQAYVTFPLCVPSRSSILTGRMPHELGIEGNRTGEAPENRPGARSDSLGRVFSAGGYDTAFAGKFHAIAADAGANDGFDVLRPFGDRGLAETAADWLTRRAPDDRPFFLTVSFDDPHTICEYARDQTLPYGDVDKIDVRDAPPLPSNAQPAVYEAEAPRHEKNVQNTVYATADYDADDWRRYRHAYARLVERADHQIGVVLEALRLSGREDNTVVVFTSDHGDGDASHAWNQKTALFQECIRVPLLVAGPGVTSSPERISASRPVSVGLDLLPTLCAVANLPVPDGLAGRDILSGDHEEGRTIVVETAFDRGERPVTRGRALIRWPYKYVIYNWGANREQLHNLEADPGEQRNLAVESRNDGTLHEMRALLLEWCIENDDRRFLKALRLEPTVEPAVREKIFEKPY